MAIEKDFMLATPDGAVDCVLFQPSEEGQWPGVLYLTDIGGIRPAQRKAALRLSSEGYVILMPNVFYRTDRPPVMDIAALRATPDLFMKRLGELVGPLTPDALASDAKAYVAFLSGLETVRDKAKLGVVGFCFCGAVAMRVAAACPDQIAACASFHGGGLYENKPTSPHLLLPEIKAELLFGHAVQDRSMPAESIASFEEALQAWGGKYESETYEGALHGWTTLDNPVYNAAQADRAYQKLTRLFSENLS
jgi:carboxymethylenebutenolidase